MDKETTIDKETIKEVLDGMIGVIENEQIDLYKSFAEKLHKAFYEKIDTVDGFHLALIYPYEKFLSGLIASKISNNHDVRFILMHSRFIEMQFRGLIERVEGSTCCADKTHTIMSGLFDFYKTGERISFNYEQEYTYHLPEKIFKTHEAITGFYEGVRGLYYGNTRRYLDERLKIAKSQIGEEGGLDDNTHTTNVEQQT